jgi:hypothetical protein
LVVILEETGKAISLSVQNAHKYLVQHHAYSELSEFFIHQTEVQEMGWKSSRAVGFCSEIFC